MNEIQAHFANYLVLFMLIFTRWLVMTIFIPFLGAALLPALVRLSLSMLLSIISFLMIFETSVFPDFSITLIAALFVKEALVGFIIGFFISLIFYAYDLFGQTIDIARSASNAKLLVPELKQQSSVMGTLLFQLALALFFSLDLHIPALKSLYQSFERFPPLLLTTNLYSPYVLGLCSRIIATLFELALRLSLPVVFTCFLIDLGFGFLNRIAPQINAYFLSLPAKMIGGLIMLFFLIPLVIDDFLQHHDHMIVFFKSLLTTN
jgi:flagellar biosynthetic protein FliR